MNRATVVYIVMIAIFAGGLWAILHAGSGLKAPPDLSGTWTVAPAEGAEAPGDAMQIEQSGRHLRLSFAGGPVLNLRAADDAASAPAVAHFRGGGWDMRATLRDGGLAMGVELDGPHRASFTARRAAPHAKPHGA